MLEVGFVTLVKPIAYVIYLCFDHAITNCCNVF